MAQVWIAREWALRFAPGVRHDFFCNYPASTAGPIDVSIRNAGREGFNITTHCGAHSLKSLNPNILKFFGISFRRPISAAACICSTSRAMAKASSTSQHVRPQFHIGLMIIR